MSELDPEQNHHPHELEIALPQWPEAMIREPQLEIEDILAVQSLTMGYLHKRARTRVKKLDERKYGFAMINRGNLDNDAETIYDGTSDTFMSCQVRKVEHDQWHMAVHFTEVINTEAAKNINTRRMYVFDWLRNGNRAAWFTEMYKARSDEGLYVQMLQNHPLTSGACLDLQDEMLEMSQKANPMSSDSMWIGPRV